MSIEKALIAQARPQMLTARAKALLALEARKGCTPELSRVPVCLEPRYRMLSGDGLSPDGQTEGDAIAESPPRRDELLRLQLWISPKQAFKWERSELFLKQLASVTRRVGLEISGNHKGITIAFLCHRYDLPVLLSSFQGEFDSCRLTPLVEYSWTNLISDHWEDCIFLDYFPPPPYSHLLTCPDELRMSPYEPLLSSIATLPKKLVGFYQVIFQPVASDHNWHFNVELLHDLEYSIKLLSGFYPAVRYAQQAPSGDLRQMAQEVDSKAHNDKPFLSVALRLAILGEDRNREGFLRALAAQTRLFQHGGRPLNFLTEEDYKNNGIFERCQEMLLEGRTYRPGFLLNSLELTGLVHVPPPGLLEDRELPLETLEVLHVRDSDLSEGTPIGTCPCAGVLQEICIPPSLRAHHTHLIGKHGMGKSAAMEGMILDDIARGHGVAVLDPHGDLVDRVACLLPRSTLDRCIYFNPGDPDWAPLWNPLQRTPGQDPGRVADDLVSAFKTVVTGWGDRLEHLLRHSLFALLQMPQMNLLDAYTLLCGQSEESLCLRREIPKYIQNEVALQFWRQDHGTYRKEDFGPPKHKLSKLLVSGTISLMLSQSQSAFTFRNIMDEGKIFLANLSTVGSEVREILGCFMLSLLHLTALSRSDTPPEKRKTFHIYCDEAHRFMTDALEDLISETRKFEVSLTLAHQYFGQFGQKKSDAISTVGSSIIFNVDTRDASRLCKDLRDMVQPQDLITLDVGEAIARVGKEIVRIRTHPPKAIPENHCRERLLELSRRKYYQPVATVREIIRRRNERWHRPFTPLVPPPHQSGENPEDYAYEQL